MYRLSSVAFLRFVVPSPSHPTLVEAELLELYVRQAPCSCCLESVPKQFAKLRLLRLELCLLLPHESEFLGAEAFQR